MATVSQTDQATSAPPDVSVTEPKATTESATAPSTNVEASAKKPKRKTVKRRMPARKSKPAAIKSKPAAKKSKSAAKKHKVSAAKPKPSSANRKASTKKVKPVMPKQKPRKTKATAVLQNRTAKKSKAAKAKPTKPINGANGPVNKAEEVRKAAKEIGGTKIRPKAVIELLATRGIEVTSPQVSSTLRAAGYRRVRRHKSAATPTPHGASAPAGLLLEDLIAAKVLISKVGSVAAAKQAVEAMAKLS
jgi:hypothetical protein